MAALRGRAAFITLTTALLASMVQAAVVTRDVFVTGADSLLRTTTDSAGNVGYEFAFDVAVSPFTVQAGDQIVTRVVFDSPLLVQDGQQNDFWSFGGGLTNLELFFFGYGYAGSNVSGIATVSDAITSFTMNLDAIGSASATTKSGTVQTSGNGMSAAYFGDGSWTDSTFLLRGLDITTNVLSYSLERGDGAFDSFGGSIFASRIMQVPEPGSAALLFAALAAMMLRTRRRVV